MKLTLGKLVGTALVLAVLLVLSGQGRTSAKSVRLTHRVDLKVQSANGCRPWLGARRYAVRRRYANESLAFRRWALRFWDGRAERCGKEKARVGVPPWFRSVMLCVHPKESSNWFLDGHHDGGLQFAPSTWDAAGGKRFASFAYDASPNEQIRAAWNLTHGSDRLLHVHWGQTIGGCL